MSFDYFKIITTINLAVIGWPIGNYFSKKRDQNLKRRDITIKH